MRSLTDSWLRRVGIALCAGVLMVAFGPPAAAAEPTSPDDMHKQLGIDDVPADYVLLVDVSGSMRGSRYQTLKDGLRKFLAAVAPQDQVSLVTFAESAKVVWRGTAGRAPDTVVSKLPAEATGTSTDIGRALEQAVKILSRDGAPSIATVVLLTDGRHQPRSGSPYPFERGYAWDQLRKEASTLTKEVLSPLAIPLAGATGAHLLGKVFTGARVLRTTSIDRISRALDEPKRTVQAAKVRQLLASELPAGVAVEWPAEATVLAAGESPLTITLRSTTRHIPMEIIGLAVSSEHSGISATVTPAAVSVPPGGTATVTVVANWSLGPADWKPYTTVTVEGALSLSGSVSTPWADALAADGVSFTSDLRGQRSVLRGSAQNGRPGTWTAAAIALVLVVLLVRGVVRRRLNPIMQGILSADVSGSPGAGMRLSGRRAAISSSTLGIGGSGTVRGRRESILSPRLSVEIAYSRDGQPGNREVQPCQPGESVTVSGVPFRWQSR
jgi:hypothetical protein